MTDNERMQREATLIATIRAKLPEFARMCADDAELVLHSPAVTIVVLVLIDPSAIAA